MTKLEELIDAINRRLVLEVRYDGHRRVIQPHAVGLSKKGDPILRCWQLSVNKPGSVQGWRLMEVVEMLVIGPTGDVFAGAQPGYKRGDSAMVRIYAQL